MQVVTKDRQDLREHQVLKELLDLREQPEPAATKAPQDQAAQVAHKVLLDLRERQVPAERQVLPALQELQAHRV